MITIICMTVIIMTLILLQCARVVYMPNRVIMWLLLWMNVISNWTIVAFSPFHCSKITAMHVFRTLFNTHVQIYLEWNQVFSFFYLKSTQVECTLVRCSLKLLSGCEKRACVKGCCCRIWVTLWSVLWREVCFWAW